MTRREFIAGLVLLVCSTGAGAAHSSRKPATHTITMEGMVFKPATLTIKPGDTVVWLNKDIVEHTATAEGKFDSRLIAPNKSWKQTFKTKGSFDYICTYHPTMKGTLVVK
jgi:plastocyanin